MPKTIAFFIGPGFGHYLPIANMAMKFSGCRPVFLAPILETHPLAQRILSDGFEFIPIVHGSMLSNYERIFFKALKLSANWLVNLLARLPSKDDLPHWSARLIFGIHSYLKPLETTSRMRTSCIEQCIGKTNPVFAFVDDVVSDPFPYICSKLQLPWIGYATGPVNVISGFEHPVYPAGISPSVVGFENWLNRLMFFFRQRRSKLQQRMLKRDFPGYKEISPNFLPQQKIAFSIAEIDDFVNAPQVGYHYLGCSLFQAQNQELPDSLKTLRKNNGKKIIYVSFGSTGSPRDELLFRLVLEAFGNEQDRQVILQISQDNVRNSIAHEISRLELKNVYVLGSLSSPPHAIYQIANLVISHGGYNTVMESLYYGVPVLLVPNIAADRMEVARRITLNGWGRCTNYYRPEVSDLKSKADILLHRSSELERQLQKLNIKFQEAAIQFEQFVSQIDVQIGNEHS